MLDMTVLEKLNHCEIIGDTVNQCR